MPNLVAAPNANPAQSLPCSFTALYQRLLQHLDPSCLNEAQIEPESKAYDAVRFVLNGQPCLYRRAKTTPTKVGHFVTLWQRPQADQAIEPWHTDAGIAWVFIQCDDPPHQGCFVFANHVLTQQKIFSNATHDGKRALRVYAPWIQPTSQQALRTQTWQRPAFVDLTLKPELLLAQTQALLQTSN
jgi:hypothetical protein